MMGKEVMRFSPIESSILQAQEAVVDSHIPKDIIERAESIVREKGETYPTEVYSFLKKKPVAKKHSVEWEEEIKEGKIHVPYGEVGYLDEGEKVVCHFCGNSYKMISKSHLEAHGLENADTYRELVGLSRNQTLSSPSYSALKRQQASELDSAQYFLDKGVPFEGGPDNRRQKPRRFQWIREHGDKLSERRKSGVPPKGTKTSKPNVRRINPWSGRFNLFNEDYFFSKRAVDTITIESITDEEITVSGKLKDGEILERSYKRKR